MASPRYRQLAETLRAAIARGDFPVGSQLPPELELAQTHGVSRHTARDAIRLLSEAGLIARRRGAGT
ncbi:MAG: GntR family transcriptional regulator, partial [Brevundimonas sp.]